MKRKKRKVLIIVTAVVLLALVGLGVSAYAIGSGFYKASNYVADEDAMDGLINSEGLDIDEVDPENATGEVLSAEEEAELNAHLKALTDAESIASDEDVYNVLLIGADRRDKSWAGNSDSMILMSLNHDKEQISMISLMRDTYVDIPGIGMRKLNAAHANGAGPLLLETVTENFKVQVDRYVSVDFNSLREIIDSMGGIELTLSSAEVRVANGYIHDMCNTNGWDDSKHLISGEGTRTCSGIQAVAYARIRYVGHADYQRTERQRTVLTQMLEKMKDMSVIELKSFVEDVLPLVTHNIPEKEIWDLLPQAPSYFKYELVKDRIPYDDMYKVIYVKKQDMLVPEWTETIQKLKATLY